MITNSANMQLCIVIAKLSIFIFLIYFSMLTLLTSLHRNSLSILPPPHNFRSGKSVSLTGQANILIFSNSNSWLRAFNIDDVRRNCKRRIAEINFTTSNLFARNPLPCAIVGLYKRWWEILIFAPKLNTVNLLFS